MKRTPMSKTLRAFLFLAACCGFATAAPYGADGMEIQWNQPGAAVLKLRVFGDDFYGRTETTKGYTVVLDRTDLTYYYAARSRDGQSLVSTGIRANLPPPAGFSKHVDIAPKRIREISLKNRDKWDTGRSKRWDSRIKAVKTLRDNNGKSVRGFSPEIAAAGILAAPVTGKMVGLTIVVQFPGEGSFPAIKFPTTPAKIERFCNQEGYSDNGNTGSVRDYFFDQSLGKLTYTQTVTHVVTLPRPRDYYNFEDFPLNRKIYENAGVSGRMLLTDALGVLVKEGFDFSSLSVNSVNSVFATNIFFAGANSGSWAEGLWPHQAALQQRFNVGTPDKPMFISNYQITNIENSAPVIGTFCHENGHLILDYPDYYSLVGEGVGEHCLMGSGNHLDGGRTPAPINAYLKDVVGWANVTDLAIQDYATHSLPATGNVAYRIRKPDTATEFFMVENRGTADRWAKFVPDKGIAIWHVDQTVQRGNLLNDPHYEISLMQADGMNDLANQQRGNRGDSRDLFDVKTPLFDGTTQPNSNWWNGNKSNVRVQVLSPAGNTMNVRFGIVPPDTIILASPNGGEVIFPDSVIPIKWEANIKGNVKIALFKGGSLLKNIVADTPNTGSYKWSVPGGLTAGNDYTIVISSITNAVPSSDASDAGFSVDTNTFPHNDTIPYGWTKPAFAKGGFKVTKSDTFEGKSSLMSQAIGDGRTAAIAYTSDFHPGNVSFYYRVSSEHDYDIARFYIDGVAQTLGFNLGISGRDGWAFFTFPLSAGVHTLMWTYEKDTSYAGGKDAAWLDGVSLPATTQQIAIENEAGDTLASGQDTHVFADTVVDSSSSTRDFTIKNVGNADLTELNISVVGPNGSDFKVGKFSTRVLAPGKSATFQVSLNPLTPGAKTAEVRVQSNDANSKTFAIHVAGNALGRPILGVNLGGVSLVNLDKVTNFGSAVVGTKGRVKTYTIVNRGSAPLGNLAIATSGSGGSDFVVSHPAATSLAPGGSTTFKVTFRPNNTKTRSAVIGISSNDARTGTFEIAVVGEGVASTPSGKGISIAKASDSKTAGKVVSTTSTEVIKGKKYVSLTVKNPASGLSAKDVEVSSNLLDWYSGKSHTTVIRDDSKMLKVRDNTPVTKGTKRHIRLR